MKVVFCYLDYSKGSQGKYYHGLASLSAMLKAHGHETDLVHVTEETPMNDVAARIDSLKPDLVAFSATTNMFPDTAEAALAYKRRSDVTTVVGGIHATIAPEDAIAQEGFDIVCIGEGEYPLLELAEALQAGCDPSHIASLWVKAKDGVIKNDIRPLTEDLDEFPMPDHDLFDYPTLEDARQKRVALMASRGCPYECAFCCNHLLKRIYKGKYVRFRSVDHIIAEGRDLNRRHAPEYAVFHDDILTLNKPWFREFADRWPREVGLKFSCNSRVNLLDAEAIEMLSKAGCIEISMGLESGDSQLRETVLHRLMTDEEIIKAFRLCRMRGIRTIAYNMVGLPFETMTKALKTVQLNAKAQPDNLQISIFYPYPHTRLYEVCRENGFLTARSAESYFETPIISQTGFSDTEVAFVFRNFGALVKAYRVCYTLPMPIRPVLEKVLTYTLKTKIGRRLFEEVI